MTRHLFALLLLCLSPLAVAEEDFLDVDDAFRIEVSADGDHLRAHWDIAPKYYLYKERFRIRAAADDTTVGDVDYPTADIKDDEFFGKVPVYHDQLTLRIPVTSQTGTANVEIRWQGCAEAGLCYPPVTRVFNVELPTQPGGSEANALSAVFTSSQQATSDAPLPAEEAFALTTRMDGNRLQAEWVIRPGYYLYRDKVTFTSNTPSVSVGAPQMPTGTPITDEYFGETPVFYDYAKAEVDVRGTPGQDVDITVQYQGCKVDSICYPPMSTRVSHTLGAMPTLSAQVTPATDPANLGPESETDRIQRYLAGNSIVMFFAFMLVGILLALTPCVLPMVPILSSIITGQGDSLTTRKAFHLSLVYVLTMAFTFALAGAAIGGSGIQSLQNPWVLSIFALILVALSLSMFGLYKLQLPSALMSRVTELSNRQEGGSIVGVGIVGVLSALIVGPCVTPPLAAALIYIANDGSIVKGFFALLGLGLGMGLPLLLVGTSAGSLVPRAGGWMNRVQHVFGFMILGLAIYMVGRVMNDTVEILLWGVLLIAFGIYFRAFDSRNDAQPGWHQVGRTVGVVSALWGILLVVGAAAGGTSLLQPLTHLRGGGNASAPATMAVEFRKVRNSADLDRELAAARADGKPVMLDFYADWCTSCIEYEHLTFPDPAVQAQLRQLVTLKADVTEQNASDLELQQRFNIVGPPTIVFFASNGQEIRNAKLVGFKNAEDFVAHLNTYVLR